MIRLTILAVLVLLAALAPAVARAEYGPVVNFGACQWWPYSLAPGRIGAGPLVIIENANGTMIHYPAGFEGGQGCDH